MTGESKDTASTGAVNQADTYLTNGSDAWHAFRRQGIGGSSLATIAGPLLGFRSYGSPWDVWAYITGHAKPERVTGWRARYGNAVEEAIARLWAEEKGVDFMHVKTHGTHFYAALRSGVLKDGLYYHPAPLVHPEIPWARCNPDSFLILDGLLWVVEIKTTGIEFRHEWKERAPARVRVQGEYYAGISRACGLDVAGTLYLCEINHDEPIEHFDAFDPEFFGNLMTIAGEWWARHIVGNEPPPFDGSKTADNWLDELFGEDPRGIILKEGDDVEVTALAIDFLKAYTVSKDAEHAVKVAKQKFKNLLPKDARGVALKQLADGSDGETFVGFKSNGNVMVKEKGRG